MQAVISLPSPLSWEWGPSARVQEVVTTLSRAVRTVIDYSGIEDANLRDVVQSWDESLSFGGSGSPASEGLVCEVHDCRSLDVGMGSGPIDLDALASVIELITTALATPEEPTGDITAYDAVRRISEWCNLSIKQVLAAAKVNGRTFYAWNKEKVRRPRLSSVGSLWGGYQAIHDLRNEVGEDLPRWLRADKARLAAFSRGDFDSLLAYHAVERLDLVASETQQTPWTHTGAVGKEVLAPGEPARSREIADGANLHRID